jgi:hypothetical protein
VKFLFFLVLLGNVKEDGRGEGLETLSLNT